MRNNSPQTTIHISTVSTTENNNLPTYFVVKAEKQKNFSEKITDNIAQFYFTLAKHASFLGESWFFQKPNSQIETHQQTETRRETKLLSEQA